MNVIPEDLHVDRQIDGNPATGSVRAAIRMLRRGIDSVAERGGNQPDNARFELGGVVTILTRMPETGHIRTSIDPEDDFRLRLHDQGMAHEEGDLCDPMIAARILRTWLAVIQMPETDAMAQEILRSRRDVAQERVLRWWRAVAAARNHTQSRIVTFGWGTPRDAVVKVTGCDHGSGLLDKGSGIEMAAHPALRDAPRSVCVIGSVTDMKIRQAISSVPDVGPTDALTAMRDLGDPDIRHETAYTES